MADYWKSTGKRYCDFCKCWTADNKASIDFHERGKNHQSNVKRKLCEIKKKSVDKRKKDETNKALFASMEKAALAAIQKDINSEGVSLGKSDMKKIAEANTLSANDSSLTYPWKAMVAPHGFTYYYNSATGESSWEMPEVFKDLERKKSDEKTADKKSSKTLNKKDPYRQTKPALVEEVHNVHPLLGGWSTISKQDDDGCGDKKLVTESSNEQSSSDAHGKIKFEVEKAFKEKMLKTRIDDISETPVEFKKRKTTNRSVRKRDEDDT
ncbi:WW domain-binding protein 4 isoform X2 [Hydra vulgaris]|uniref:WW domain-binding protein 4 isoform X2 n=1 Tax=Hydra vulgaris TaxID=6087 RepID=A0ABM4CZK6_HYDVU